MIRITTSLLLALTLAACGGSDGTTDVGDDAEIAVRSSADAEEAIAGGIVSFTARLTNTGPAESGRITLKEAVTGVGTLAGVECTAVGGALCPSDPGPAMTVDSLPVGGALIFTISVSTTPEDVGVVHNTLIASADNDPDDTNNRGDSSTVTTDPRNGDYTVYGSNGRQYTLSLNFQTMNYELSGQQMSRSGIFTADPDGVSYVFEGTARFRVAQDMVVGGFPFNLNGSTHPYDLGVRPIVAARKFSTQLATLDGRHYNLMGLNLRRNNTLESVVYPSKFEHDAKLNTDVLKSCRSPLVSTVEKCPTESLSTYALTVLDTEIVGTDAVNQDVIHFRLAQSGDMLVILRAEDVAIGRHFRVGLAETSGLAGGHFGTSDTGSAWGMTDLTDLKYQFLGKRSDGAVVDVSADLASLGADHPAGVRRGLLAGGLEPVYLGQNGDLMLMLGADDGAAKGTMDIGLR